MMRLLAFPTMMSRFAIFDECPGRRQFMQRLFVFSVDTILSCDNDLKREQAYKGCFSVLQRTQLAVTLAAKDATGLLAE